MFTVPNANYLEMIAIGAGGSSTTNDLRMTLVPGANSGSGSLRIDNHFQEDIDASVASIRDEELDATVVDKRASLPRKIRDALDDWAKSNQRDNLFAEYTNIISPIGRGGTGKCQARYANSACSAVSPAGSFYEAHEGDSTNFTSGCWWFQKGKGGNSGKGLKVDSVRFPLSGDSIIKIDEDINRAGVSITSNIRGSNSISLSASGNGGDPVWASTKFNDGLDSNQRAVCSSSGSGSWCAGASEVPANPGNLNDLEIPEMRTCDDMKAQATQGHIEYLGKGGGNGWSGGAINWQYQDPAVNVTFARKGDYGVEAAQVFENLKGVLHLIPARNNTIPSVVQRVDGTELLRAASGVDNGGDAATMTLPRVGLSDRMPYDITDNAVPDNEGHFKYIGKLTNSGYDIPILGCVQERNCPGYAGTGTYLLVRNTASLEFLTLTNRRNGAFFTKNFDNDEYRDEPEECLHEDELHNSDYNWARVCKGAVKNGSPGAIVIIW